MARDASQLPLRFFLCLPSGAESGGVHMVLVWILRSLALRNLPKKAIPVKWPCSAVVHREPCGLAMPTTWWASVPSFVTGPALSPSEYCFLNL